jgi:hypothetical protein
MFKDMLTDVAAGEIGARHIGDRLANFFRGNASTAILGFKAMTGAVNLTGIVQAMKRMPKGQRRLLFKAIEQWARSTKDQQNSVAWMMNKSRAMRNRLTTLNQIYKDMSNQFADFDLPRRKGLLGSIGRKSQAWRDASWWIIHKTQLAVDTPIWIASYNWAIKQGVSENEAIARADTAVADTQGSARIMDLSKIQRSSPLVKMFHMFYFYNNVQYNLTSEAFREGRRTAKRGTPVKAGIQVATDMTILWIAASAVEVAVRVAFRGADEDDSLVETFFDKWWKNTIGGLGSTIPFLREPINSAIHSMPWNGPGGMVLLSESITLLEQLQQFEWDDALRKSLLNTLGYMTGIPAGQLNATLDGVGSITDGEVTGPLESIRALIFGRPYKDR